MTYVESNKILCGNRTLNCVLMLLVCWVETYLL